MNFVVTSIGITEKYSVSEKVLLDVIDYCIAENKNIKLANEARVSFLEDKSNVMFVIDIKVKKGADLKETIEKFRQDVINEYKNLLDFEPSSVRVCFVGYF